MSDIKLRIEHTQIVQHITGGRSPLEEITLHGQ